jgi:hypothetical protein
MSTAQAAPRRDGALALGGVLIVVGLIAFALQQVSIDVTDWLGGSGWTLFIIGPGIALLAGAFLTRSPAAQGLTTAGCVVTAIGLLLLFQDQTGNWESWAYAWAIIPGAVGISLLIHGLRVGRGDLRAAGFTLIGIATALLVAGAWYFEAIFRTGRVPLDFSGTWPVILIVIGGIVIVSAILRRPGESSARG